MASNRDNDLDLGWGASSLRQDLNLRTDSQVYSMIRSGALDGVVKKIGSSKRAHIGYSRRALREKFEVATA